MFFHFALAVCVQWKALERPPVFSYRFFRLVAAPLWFWPGPAAAFLAVLCGRMLPTFPASLAPQVRILVKAESPRPKLSPGACRAADAGCVAAGPAALESRRARFARGPRTGSAPCRWRPRRAAWGTSALIEAFSFSRTARRSRAKNLPSSSSGINRRLYAGDKYELAAAEK